MVQQLIPTSSEKIIYPDRDGKPMSDNTLQFYWIVIIKENLELLFSNNPKVFVAGDLLWYPIQGNKKIRRAPDIMIVLGRPKGYRGSYKQWEEEHIAATVVFEIISPGNTVQEMGSKFEFYQNYGVQEYYVYNPHGNSLEGWYRKNNLLEGIKGIQGWISPNLGIKFELLAETLAIYGPDGEKFYSFVELDGLRQEQKERAEQERQRAEQERQRAEQERQRAEQEQQKAEQERQRAQQEQQKAEQERQRAQQEQQKAERAEKTIDEAINRMSSMGMTIEQIAEILGRNLTEINDKLN